MANKINKNVGIQFIRGTNEKEIPEFDLFFDQNKKEIA